MAGSSLVFKLLFMVAALAAFVHIALGTFPQGPTFDEIESGAYQKP